MIEKEEIGYIIYMDLLNRRKVCNVEIIQSFTIDCEVEQIVQWQAGSNDCSDYQQCQLIEDKEYSGLRS